MVTKSSINSRHPEKVTDLVTRGGRIVEGSIDDALANAYHLFLRPEQMLGDDSRPRCPAGVLTMIFMMILLH